MADEQMVKVRFSEVHWYEVTLPRAELARADSNRDPLRLPTGDPDKVPPGTGELLTAASIDQSGALKEVDGQEISWVRLVS